MTPKQKVDEPLVPDELQNRGGIALTQWAAEPAKDGTAVDRIALEGDTAGAVPLRQAPGLSKDTIAFIDQLCANPPGFNATAGLKADEVLAIMARTYPGMPPMGPTGDLDPNIIIWLYNNHPADARVRYALRLMPSVSKWISRWYPDWKWEAPVLQVKWDSPVLPIPTGSAEPTEADQLRAKIAAIKAAKAAREKPVDPEVLALRAELAALEGGTPDVLPPVKPAKIPTRRPRKPSPSA
jgi:hypothetical protein